MIADETTITGYIPQRPPMVMIGNLISAEDKKTVTSFLIRSDTIFVSNGVLREAGLIENMAQTAAAGAGFSARRSGKEPRIGFIGGIKNLEFFFLPGTGQEIVTETVVDFEVQDALVTSCKVFADKLLCASCELKIFLK
jgi:predicted hotdog family 3-hydroxylacyl-ACP dehydratase